MRALSKRQVRACEQALTHACQCRCGGLLHGAKRGGDHPPREFFENLPSDDPHHLKPQRQPKAPKPKRDDLPIQLALPFDG